MTVPVPRMSAIGRLRAGFRISAAAKVTLFHASMENSAPTSAAANVNRYGWGVGAWAKNAAAEKLALTATTFLPIVSPSPISTRSAPTFATVKALWIRAPVRTPRQLTAVSAPDDRERREALWGESELQCCIRSAASQRDDTDIGCGDTREPRGANGRHENAQKTAKRDGHPQQWCRSESRRRASIRREIRA